MQFKSIVSLIIKHNITRIRKKDYKMRRDNTKYFVIGLIAFTLILTGAYAIFNNRS